MNQVDRLATGLMFPEGPAIGSDGALYVTEIAGQRISKIAEDGTVSTYVHTGGGPNGAAFDAKGDLLVCNNGGKWPLDVPSTSEAGEPEDGPGRMQRVTTQGEVIEELLEIDGIALNSPNDVCFDAHGGYYFTDPVWSGLVGGDRAGGPVCYVNAEGEASRAVANIGFPNGLGVRADGNVLIVCESLTGMLLSYRIEEPDGDRFLTDFASTRLDGSSWLVMARAISSSSTGRTVALSKSLNFLTLDRRTAASEEKTFALCS